MGQIQGQLYSWWGSSCREYHRKSGELAMSVFCLLLKTSDHLDFQLFFFFTRQNLSLRNILYLKKTKQNPLLNDYHSGNIAQAKRHYYVLTQVLEFPILPCDSTIWSLSTGWFANLFGVDTRISGLDQEVVPLVYVMCLPHEVMVNLQACEDGSQKRFTSAKLTSWQARRSFPGTEYRHLVYHR